ncbi:MAG: CAP domain-containing protein [bacterium]|nr:CAP domain-containing protein [bacterium]MCP4965248.1 CAP domain-containing protein [bacterium]
MAALARRFASVLLTTVMVVGLMAPAASAASYESDALALLNEARAANGLAPVAMHSDLTDDAQAWSQHLQSQGSLSHNPNLGSVTTGWDKLGENVGVGVSMESLHNAFMSSSGHRRNILGDYNYVGIAVVEETSSKLWVTVVFMKTLDAAPVVTDDPEPYANQETATVDEQPIAAAPRTAAPAAPSVAIPAPAVKIVMVSNGASPIAI